MRYAKHLDERNLSASTFNIYINNLSMVFSVLSSNAGLKSNVWNYDMERFSAGIFETTSNGLSSIADSIDYE